MERKGPRYKVEREIGRGAFGVVYLANDNLLQRRVALKVVSIPDGLTPQEREHLVERFYREARAAAGLSHPNIVIIHDISRTAERHFISMEFLEGQPLSEVIAGGPLPLERALKIADEVLAALAYAHYRNVVHRDIKPDNIFLLPGDRVKLVDFGLARVQATTTITRSGAVMGSPGYIAPEVVEGRQADSRTDIFSFGVVLYEMLTAARPFGPENAFESFAQVIYRVMSQEPVPPSSINPAVSPELDSIVLRCLAKDPDARYQDAVSLREGLASAAGARPASRADEVTPSYPAEARGPITPWPAGPAPGVTVDQSVSATVSEEPGGFGRPGSGITESVVEGWEDEGPATRKRGGRLKWWLAGGAALLAAAGAVIAVLLFTGLLAGKETRVPNLINLPAGQADKALAEAHLKKGKVTEGFSFDIWKDKIMKQMPSAGTKVTRDSTVDMVVSMGNDVVQVPEVLNMPEAEAEQTLKVFGFNVKKESAYRAGVPVGYVFEARPAPGAIKPRGTEVTLVVNTGQPAVKKPAGNQKKPAVSAPLP